MSFKVAVASSDGNFINQHFGHAQKFYIFDLDTAAEEFPLLEVRERKPVCSGQIHDDQALWEAAKALKDCQAVFASQIGPRAQEVLQAGGIHPYAKVSDIDTALLRLATFRQERPGFFHSTGVHNF